MFFRVAEAIFVGWFTIEYLVRFVVAPKKVCNQQDDWSIAGNYTTT